MDNVQIRPVVATDLPRLVGIEHACTSDYVWQLDLRKENGQVLAGFREVRLPRPIRVSYPRDPFTLADDWTKRSANFVALIDDFPVGYVCILEHTQAATAWVTDLVVNEINRRWGIGSALLTAAQDWATSRSDHDIFMEMSSKNYPAVCLARKFRFAFCGYNDHYYVTQDVALFFGRSLL